MAIVVGLEVERERLYKSVLIGVVWSRRFHVDWNGCMMLVSLTVYFNVFNKSFWIIAFEPTHLHEFRSLSYY